MEYFKLALINRLNDIQQGLYDSLPTIEKIESQHALSALSVMLEFACTSTHASAIEAGREAICLLPCEWLASHIEGPIAKVVNLTDYWEYRMLLDVLASYCPSLLERYVQIGLSEGNDLGVIEAANDYL